MAVRPCTAGTLINQSFPKLTRPELQGPADIRFRQARCLEKKASVLDQASSVASVVFVA